MAPSSPIQRQLLVLLALRFFAIAFFSGAMTIPYFEFLTVTKSVEVAFDFSEYFEYLLAMDSEALQMVVMATASLDPKVWCGFTACVIYMLIVMGHIFRHDLDIEFLLAIF